MVCHMSRSARSSQNDTQWAYFVLKSYAVIYAIHWRRGGEGPRLYSLSIFTIYGLTKTIYGANVSGNYIASRASRPTSLAAVLESSRADRFQLLHAALGNNL